MDVGENVSDITNGCAKRFCHSRSGFCRDIIRQRDNAGAVDYRHKPLLHICRGGVQLSSLGVNNPLWYVSVLFICDAILYCLIRISASIKVSVHYFYIAMVLLGLGIHYWNINLPFMNGQVSRGYVCFFLGMLLYELYEKHGNDKKLFMISFLITAAVLFCVVKNYMIDDIWAILTFILFPAVLFSFLGAERIFFSKIFAVLGAVSFEMYLWHVPFLCLYKPARKVLGITVPITHIEMICFTVVLILFCAPTALVLEKKIKSICKKFLKFDNRSAK